MVNSFFSAVCLFFLLNCLLLLLLTSAANSNHPSKPSSHNNGQCTAYRLAERASSRGERGGEDAGHLRLKRVKINMFKKNKRF
jgi:hypothetical protein